MLFLDSGMGDKRRKDCLQAFQEVAGRFRDKGARAGGSHRNPCRSGQNVAGDMDSSSRA
jgi:hypothetical protein